jgi:hypothetical protein
LSPAGTALGSAAGWSIEPTAVPAGARAAELSAVSCRSRTACSAVGYATSRAGAGVTLAEQRSGSQWSVTRTPALSGARAGFLSAVSCTGPRACTAVGFSNDADRTQAPVAEHWTGARWAQQRPRYPAGARSAQFAGGSCPSSRECTAVGLFNDARGADAMLVERSDGGRWTIERTPTTAGASGRSLAGIACRSATLCAAVGSSTNQAGAAMTLAARSS